MNTKKLFLFLVFVAVSLPIHSMYTNMAKKIFSKKALFATAAIIGTSAGARKVFAQEETKPTLTARPYSFIFSHGLGSNKNAARVYQEEGIVYSKLVHTFNYPDVKPGGGVDATQVSLGQEPDIAALNSCFTQATDANNPVVMFGVSRGAATIINFLAAHPANNVRAVVLESPFDHVDSIVKNKVGLFSSVASYALPYMYGKYNANGPQPIKHVGSMPKDVPVMFICSKQDSLIPATSTQELYRELKKNGHEHAHIMTLDSGAHANILWGREGDTYRNTVHAFYEKYKLPHNPEWAQQGKEVLGKCQPTVEELSPKKSSSVFASLSSSK